MRDAFFLELRKVNNDINRILNGDSIDEKIRIVKGIEDSIDMLQTITIVITQDSFLDAFVKLGEYEDLPGIKELGEILSLYVEIVEIGRIKGTEETGDARLMDLYLLKHFSTDREAALQLSLLIFIMGFISLKNRESLQERHERLMSMIPEQIAADYTKGKRFKALKDFEIERVANRLLSLSYGNEVSVPDKATGYNLISFIDSAISEFTNGETQKLIKELSDCDLVNTMDVISGANRKKLFDNMAYEEAATISQKIIVFSIIVSAEDADVFSGDETEKDLNERILPSVRKAVEAVISVSGDRFMYVRKNQNGRNQKRLTKDSTSTKED